MSGAILQTERLSWGYNDPPLGAKLQLTLAPGEAAALVGPNGAGKTALIKTIAGQLPPLSGRVLVSGQAVEELDSSRRAQLVAMLPQNSAIDEGLTVRELVELGRTPHLGLWGAFCAEDSAAVARALALCQLEQLAHRPLSEVSGGERQRARIALTVAQESPLLLLDEPANHLDLKRRYELFAQLRQLRTDQGTAVLLVLHDLADAYREADRVYVLTGSGVEQIPAEDPDRRERLARAFDVPPEQITL